MKNKNKNIIEHLDLILTSISLIQRDITTDIAINELLQEESEGYYSIPQENLENFAQLQESLQWLYELKSKQRDFVLKQ